MAEIKDFPTVFRINGKEAFRLDGLLPLPNGMGVTIGDGEQYQVVGAWLHIEHHGEDDEGLYIDLAVT
jgi:hypothetical protein